MMRAAIHVNVWGREKRADIWIFGVPKLQREVAAMLNGLAHDARWKLMESKYGPSG